MSFRRGCAKLGFLWLSGLGCGLGLGAFSVDPALAARPAAQELDLRAQYLPSPEPLTTEKVWSLDPDELNPHRQRWVLNRQLELVGLQARELSPESYGVKAEGLSSVATAYFRPQGPWYRGFDEFPCTTEPVSWFGNLEGSQAAAQEAAHQWERALSESKLKLSMLLGRVTARSPGLALKKADLLFQAWLREVSEDWRTRGRPQAKLAEWKLYRERAAQAKACRQKGSGAQAPIPWEVMMEPPGTGEEGRGGSAAVAYPTSAYDEKRLLARAPSKRWDGLYSIRVNVIVAGRKLNGRFLIDSGVGQSVISPEWLEGQGILPAWILTPGASPKRVPWSGNLASDRGGLAPVASVDRVEIGNTEVDLKEFVLFDTEFFSPPEVASSCCDGVLGTDFLRKYVVELHPGPPSEVKLWSPKNFHLAESAPSQWVETGLTPAGDPVSACTARSGKLKLVGARWDTGRASALDIHIPWQGEARKASRSGAAGWEVSCGPAPAEPIARAVPGASPKMDVYENKAIQGKVPAFSIGMPLLGRGRVFLDFPHGRIWFPDQTSEAPIRVNRSGLELEFSFARGNTDRRELKVTSISRTGSSKPLYDRGLRAGMVITLFDSANPGDLNNWEVEQRLAGAGGDTLTLQWKSPRGLRLGQLKLK